MFGSGARGGGGLGMNIALEQGGPNHKSDIQQFAKQLFSTVEPRLSGLVGTSVNSPDNRKYEY